MKDSVDIYNYIDSLNFCLLRVIFNKLKINYKLGEDNFRICS